MADEIQGGTVAEVAAPQSTETIETVDTGVDNSAAAEQIDSPAKPAQSQDDNARFAAARRESETALKTEREKFSHTTELIKNYGATNGCYSDADVSAKYGSTDGITTLDQLAAEVERQAAIQRGEPDPQKVKSMIDEAVSNHPLIKAAQEAQAKSTMDGWVSELKTAFPDEKFDGENPSLGLPEDVATQMSLFIKRGFSPVEAYVQANWKSIQSKSTAAGKQAALNDLNSKGHLKPTGGGVDVSNVNVPPETYKLYKTMNKGMTDEQIKKHYAKSLKEGF
jgi:hypothetical protein